MYQQNDTITWILSILQKFVKAMEISTPKNQVQTAESLFKRPEAFHLSYTSAPETYSLTSRHVSVTTRKTLYVMFDLIGSP